MDTDKDDTSGRERDPAGGRRGCMRVHVTVVSADRTGVVSPLSCHLRVASHASVPSLWLPGAGAVSPNCPRRLAKLATTQPNDVDLKLSAVVQEYQASG